MFSFHVKVKSSSCISGTEATCVGELHNNPTGWWLPPPFTCWCWVTVGDWIKEVIESAPWLYLLQTHHCCDVGGALCHTQLVTSSSLGDRSLRDCNGMLWGTSCANYAIGEEEIEGNDEMGDDSDHLFLLALHDTCVKLRQSLSTRCLTQNLYCPMTSVTLLRLPDNVTSPFV